MYYCRCVCLAETVGAHSICARARFPFAIFPHGASVGAHFICARAVRGGGSIPGRTGNPPLQSIFFASTRYYRTAMHSISTSAPFGSAAICTQLRAGKPPWK